MRHFAFVFFLLYLAALTFPGYALFSRPEPWVLGLPFSFAWVILWVILGWVVLFALHVAEGRRGRE